jgi:hypothetical protein
MAKQMKKSKMRLNLMRIIKLNSQTLSLQIQKQIKMGKPKMQ